MAEKKKEEQSLDIEDMDIDSVDLSSVDMDDTSLDDMDLSSFGEVEDTIDKPHFKMSTKDFKEILKVAKLVSTGGGRDIVSKSVMFQVKDGKVVASMTDLDTFVTKTVECLNQENVLTIPVVISTDILIKLSKALPVNTVIYLDGEDIYMRLYGGDILVETFAIDSTKFEFKDEIEDTKVKINSTAFYTAIKDQSPIVCAAVSPSERRIILQKERSIASFMWAISVIKGDFGEFDLKIKDINMLKSLLNGTDEELSLFRVKNAKVERVVVEGTNFSYAFLVSGEEISETLASSVEDTEVDYGVYVDLVSIFKMVEVAADLPYSTGKVGINYTEDGVQLSIKTKKGNPCEFTIPGSVQGNCSPLSSELVVQAKLLRTVLRTFATKSSIMLTLTPKGIIISADNYASIVYTEAK